MKKIKDEILEYMRQDAYKPMLSDEIAAAFYIDKGQYREFKKILQSMEKEGLIFKTKRGKYGVPEKMNLITGRLQGNQKGFGFIIQEDSPNDVFIAAENMNGAMNGDSVVAKIIRIGGKNKNLEGEIIKIVKRANTKIVGTFEKSTSFGFVVPDDKRIYQDIFIPKAQTLGSKTGYKVVVEVTKWPEKHRNPEGKVIEILGESSQPGVDILSIIRKYGLPEKFPLEVEEFVEDISDEIPESEYKKRRDLRGLKIVTIDGEDAKDLDDAVSIEKLSDGCYRLGVHIADVTYYVKEKSPLDKEAFKRATSVYLVDRVIPMLPKKLSNGLCSLNPKVPRLTLSCVMVIDPSGKVIDHDIFESIIQTSERMTYNDVTKILKDNDQDTVERYKYLVPEFKLMEELCIILNKKRMDRGALDFDFDESKIVLNEQGFPIEIKPYEREIANRIIEEFMLVCNETVAEHMYNLHTPFIYRIHENPDSEKLESFAEFIHNLGYFMRIPKEMNPKVLQAVINEASGKKEQTLIDTLMLRSMKQARYSPECSGHFGLAAEYYCHFTSPIRRYPDLAIHRIIKEQLKGKLTDKRTAKLKSFVDNASRQSSDMERIAQDAERETDDLKKVEYMSQRIGQIYTGMISSVTSFGMFVALDNTVEGLVHISNIPDDYYIYDEKLQCLIGEKLKKIYRLGDTISVKVIKTDIDTRTIDFSIIEDV